MTTASTKLRPALLFFNSARLWLSAPGRLGSQWGKPGQQSSNIDIS